MQRPGDGAEEGEGFFSEGVFLVDFFFFVEWVVAVVTWKDVKRQLERSLSFQGRVVL